MCCVLRHVSVLTCCVLNIFLCSLLTQRLRSWFVSMNATSLSQPRSCAASVLKCLLFWKTWCAPKREHRFGSILGVWRSIMEASWGLASSRSTESNSETLRGPPGVNKLTSGVSTPRNTGHFWKLCIFGVLSMLLFSIRFYNDVLLTFGTERLPKSRILRGMLEHSK